MSSLIPIPTPRVSIPERTVDAWVAVYLTTQFPSIRLWAPTTRGWDDWDYAGDPGLGEGKLFVLECKSTVPIGKDHVARVGWRQLYRYLALPLTRSITYYVFPSPPWVGSPGVPPPLVPAEAAQWRGCENWMYVVGARDLRRHYGITQDTEVSASAVTGIAGSQTLTQFAAALRSCQAGRRIGRSGDDDGQEWPPDLEPDEDLDLQAWAADAGKPQMTPIVGFIPASDLA